MQKGIIKGVEKVAKEGKKVFYTVELRKVDANI